jgi:shikimate dehydrogenase
MELYGVMGNPIQHSISPRIHQLFAQQTKQLITYSPILVEIEKLAGAIDDFQQVGGKGLNITLPFKHRAFGLTTQHSARALAAQAVNTILFKPDGSRYGDNTDGVGLINDLVRNKQFDFKNKKILILGAGGVVRGILPNLLATDAKAIFIANRTAHKAQDLVEKFKVNHELHTCDFNHFDGLTFDLIINATSASLLGGFFNLPQEILQVNTFCYDIMYGRELTPFLLWAKLNGVVNFTDGLGMLVEQAAEAFFVWRGVRPETASVFELLRAEYCIS